MNSPFPVPIVPALLGIFCLAPLSQTDAQAQEADDGSDRQIHLRVEIYDLPAKEALRVQQEVSLEPDQTGTLERIRTMVDSGEAAFVTSFPLVGRPGSRAKHEDTVVVPVVESFTWNEEARQLVPQFSTRPAGTIFEVDPAITADGETLDLNFALEHHTGDPETEILQVPIGDNGESREVSVTRFHYKKLVTRIFVEPGTAALVAAWEITGKTGSTAIPDAKRLAFLSAGIEGRD